MVKNKEVDKWVTPDKPASCYYLYLNCTVIIALFVLVPCLAGSSLRTGQMLRSRLVSHLPTKRKPDLYAGACHGAMNETGSELSRASWGRALCPRAKAYPCSVARVSFRDLQGACLTHLVGL